MAKKKSSGDGEGTETEAKATKKKTAAKKPAAKKAAARAGKTARGKKKDAEEPAEVVDTAPEVADVIEAEIIAETPVTELQADSTDEPPAALSEEEQELSAIYGDDLSKPATAHAEFQDNKTRDEDRPMMPEINAREERKARWEDRRERRRRERDERRARRDQGGQRPQHEQRGGEQRGGEHRGGEQRGEQRGGEHRGGEQRQFEQRPPQQPPQLQARPSSPQINGHDHDQLARVGTPLGDAAAAVFQQLRNGQPLPVRQLAAMMRKRSLVNQEPEQLWPQLKAELLGDERSYRTLGLRPRIVYRGRDLFAPGPVSMSVTADAEAGVASALSKLASATHRALSHRLAKASPAGFERIIHAYLVAAGYRDIDWVKRIGGISYASAVAPGLDRTVLISARSGSEPIDRRGIGELRVGVEAKDLVTGILMTPGELSEDAERELERAGRSISVVCGDQLVAALIQAGVGVVSSAAPLHYLDDQLLEELLAG
jgi:hypothetical protein